MYVHASAVLESIGGCTAYYDVVRIWSQPFDSTTVVMTARWLVVLHSLGTQFGKSLYLDG